MDLSVLEKVPKHLKKEAKERLEIVAKLEPLFPGLNVKVRLPGDYSGNGNGVYRVIVFQDCRKVYDISGENREALIAQALQQNGTG